MKTLARFFARLVGDSKKCEAIIRELPAGAMLIELRPWAWTKYVVLLPDHRAMIISIDGWYMSYMPPWYKGPEVERK